MPDEIKPALTPEEWQHWLVWRENSGMLPACLATQQGVAPSLSEEHGTAALCLYGQPFGFTHEDVTLLNRAVIMEPYAGALTPDPNASAKLFSLIARIAALLPPEP